MLSPKKVFHSAHYLAHNKARIDHLQFLLRDLQLDPVGRSVLEIGAGIGDHSEFWLSKGAVLTATDARKENVDILRERFPDAAAFAFDADNPSAGPAIDEHDIVYAYGLLYHLRNPDEAIAFLADKCRDVMLLETCVSLGDEITVNHVDEMVEDPSQAVSGIGCRPTRAWVFQELKKYFPYVYQPSYQPVHDQFPLDWSSASDQQLNRATFIASRKPQSSVYFFSHILDQQVHRLAQCNSAEKGIDALLARTEFSIVLDVGANQGQFVKRMRALDYAGPIVSFEPLDTAADRLDLLAQEDKQLKTLRCALGKERRKADLQISGNSVSSSFLEIEETIVEAEPLAAVIGAQSVQIERLDDLWSTHFPAKANGFVLLKLDVQGLERDVLEGAAQCLSKISHVLMGCSLVSVYRGEPLIEEHITYMRKRGFAPISIDLGWSDKRSGRTYQVDVLFARS